jgi:hypothetical protein
MEIDKNKPGFLSSKKGFVPTQVRYVFDLLPTLIFHVKIQLSFDLSDQDPDPQGSLPLIRIRQREKKTTLVKK